MSSWGSSPMRTDSLISTCILTCSQCWPGLPGSPEPPPQLSCLESHFHPELALADPLTPRSQATSPAHHLVQPDPCNQSDTWTGCRCCSMSSWASVTRDPCHGAGTAVTAISECWHHRHVDPSTCRAAPFAGTQSMYMNPEWRPPSPGKRWK